MVQAHTPSNAAARTLNLDRTPNAPSWLEIDLSRIEANVRALRGVLGVLGSGVRGSGSGTEQTGHASSNTNNPASPQNAGTEPRTPDPEPRTLLCAVVKKNAYGLGAPAIAHRLSKAGVDMFAVYAPEEAEQLIRASIDTPMLVMMPVRTLDRTSVLYRHAVAGKLHLTVHDVDQLQALNEVGRTFGMRVPVHLFVDTGMSRSGLNDTALTEILEALPTLRFITPAGICSHLASADTDPDSTDQQRTRFEAAIEAAQPALSDNACRHLANTYGTLRNPRLHMDMVRCGLGLFGYGPTDMNPPAQTENTAASELAPILRWLSRLIHVQRYPANASVGYGHTHTLQRDSVLGIVPVGYGDGYPLELSNKAQVRLLDDQGAPKATCDVLGRVNMDQIVIDLTDAMQGDPQALMRRTVELVSDDLAAPNALPRLAAQANLHCYAMLCGLNPALPRQYLR